MLGLNDLQNAQKKRGTEILPITVERTHTKMATNFLYSLSTLSKDLHSKTVFMPSKQPFLTEVRIKYPLLASRFEP